MAFYSAASNRSLWRGIGYYEEHKVQSHTFVDEHTIQGVVLGDQGNVYEVRIDLEHPRKSTCNCPFAEGRKVICKHMIALYFASVPGSYKAFQEEMERLEVQYELEEERWRKEMRSRIEKEVKALSAKQVREKLVDMLYQNELDARYRDEYEYW